MRLAHRTIATTRRHRELFYCEESDFAELKLFVLDKSEKKLIISTKEDEFIAFEEMAYRKINSDYHFRGCSREESEEQISKQGRISEKIACKYISEERDSMNSNFSCISNANYILIGRALYYEYCKVSDLKITRCGNLLFGKWLSIDIEAEHCNKANFELTKESFKNVVKKAKEDFKSATASNKVGVMGIEGFLSIPKKVVFG
jgi:hypothetical protein